MEWKDEQLVDEAIYATTKEEFDSLMSQTNDEEVKDCINFYRARNEFRNS